MGAHRNFSREGQGLGDMASAEHKPIMGVWGQKSRLAQGRAPGQGDQAKPLKLKALKHLHT